MKPQINTVGLVAWYKLWAGLTSSALVFDYAQGGFNGTVTGTNCAAAYPGFSFNGTDDYIDVGSGPTSVSTVLMWVKPDSVTATTDYPIDLNGTDYLTIVNGTLTKNGFAGGTTALYVNGLTGTSVTTDWTLIGITDTTAKNASDLDIGKETANFFTGRIGETLIYSTVLGADDIRSVYELTRWRYK